MHSNRITIVRNTLVLFCALCAFAIALGAEARIFNTEHGRWTRRDPLGYVDGMNKYAYGHSAPNLAVDPSGTNARCAASLRRSEYPEYDTLLPCCDDQGPTWPMETCTDPVYGEYPCLVWYLRPAWCIINPPDSPCSSEKYWMACHLGLTSVPDIHFCKERAFAIGRKYPGRLFGPGNAMRHCFLACCLTKELGCHIATWILVNHERCDLLDPDNEFWDTLQDDYNNCEGQKCAGPGVDCESCCLSKLCQWELEFPRPWDISTFCKRAPQPLPPSYPARGGAR